MKRTKDLKTNKGITLIALVITIIVMLILVGVTISMAVNGGLFSQAGEATGKTKNAINAEQELANGKIEIEGEWYNSIDEYLNGGKEPTGITIKGISSEVCVRDTITLSVEPNQGTISSEYVVDWKSSNETVATVNNGVVTGGSLEETKQETEVIITAELKKDNTVVATATKEILVKPMKCPDCTYGFVGGSLEGSIDSECSVCGAEVQAMAGEAIYFCHDCGVSFTSSGEYDWSDCESTGHDLEVIAFISYDYMCYVPMGQGCEGRYGTIEVGYAECDNCVYGMIYE